MKSPEEMKQHDSQLRVAAETELHSATTAEPAQGEAAGSRPVEELVHELQVHQIELEMQNETLRQSQLALEESRDRYVEFYDFAPVGYLTLTDKGVIAEINLAGAAMLGADRARLLQRRFSPSVAAEDRDRWHRHVINALKRDAKLNCELVVLRPDGSRIDVRLDSLRLTNAGKATILRVVLTDITARRRAEKQLREMAAGLEEEVQVRTSQLRGVSRQLTLTEERERSMLAQDLHDNLGQLLAVIKIKLNALAAGSLQSPVNQIVELVGKAERSVRTITMELSPPILHTLGFVPALEWLVEEMMRVYGLTVHFDDEHAPKPLVDEIQAMLYRSVRELLINVARHARVSEASLYCHCDGSRLMLVVGDDGCGFDPADFPVGVSGQRTFGLSSIYERVTNIGGEMEIDSSPGNGTTITLTVPCFFAAKEQQP